MTEYLSKWSAIVNAENKTSALKDHFVSLGIQESTGKIVEELFKEINSIEVVDGELHVSIPWAHNNEPVVIVFSSPYKGEFDKSVPKSFREFYTAHNGVRYFHKNEKYLSFEICGVNKDGKIEDNGTWEYEFVEEGGNEEVLSYLEEKDLGPEDITCFGVYDAGQNWFLLHPICEDSFVSPRIVSFSHESCDMEDEVSEKPLIDFIILQLADWIRDVYPEEQK